METKTRIIVACFKESPIHKDDIYVPMQGGRAKSSYRLDMEGDDEGDNISDKNYLYCENTYIYNAWKRFKNIDIIGLCHYRRYFDFHHQGKLFLPHTKFSFSQMEEMDYSIPPRVLDKVRKGAVVLASENHYPRSVMDHFCISHNYKDFYKLEYIISQTQPKKYKKAFDKVMRGSNHFHPNNLFIMNWDNFNRYCSWLFPLLKRMEEEIDIAQYDSYQSLLFGFYSERLINVWVEANNLEVISRPVLFFEDGNPVNESSLRCLVKRISYALGNFLTKPRS